MELLLNLFWAILFVPAAMIWWRERRFAQNLGHRRFSPPLVSLICLLALLFPVLSATDDMQAMRGEVEESGPSKRVVKQSASLQSSAWANDGGSPASLIEVVSFYPDREACGKVSEYLPALAELSPAITIGCRAPPAS
jgi:hypothetical protein